MEQEYSTYSCKELLHELEKTKIQLFQKNDELINVYKKTKKTFVGNNNVLNILRYYVESHSISKVITDSQKTQKIIENILSEKEISGNYLTNLDLITRENRRIGIGDFKEDWNIATKGKGDQILYTLACSIDDWISDCHDILNYIKYYIGTSNPLIDLTKLKNEKIKLAYLSSGGICLDTKRTLCYRPTYASDRYKILEKIIKLNGKPINAKGLNRHLGKPWNGINSSIGMSNQIKDINRLINKNLSIKEKVILGDTGYSLNTEDYEIINT